MLTLASKMFALHPLESVSFFADEYVTETRQRYSRPKIERIPDPWDESENYHMEQVGGVIGVGLGMRSAGGVIMDGGVIDDDDLDCIVENMDACDD